MSKIVGYLRDESGAEMVEWTVVVAVLAVVAFFAFGPNGTLSKAINNGINQIAATLNLLPTANST